MWGWHHDTLEMKDTLEIGSWMILTFEVTLNNLKISNESQPQTLETETQLCTDIYTRTFWLRPSGIRNMEWQTLSSLIFGCLYWGDFIFCSVISPRESNNWGGFVQYAWFGGIIHVVIIWANYILSGELYSPMQMGIIWDGNWNKDKILCLEYCAALKLILLVSYSNPLYSLPRTKFDLSSQLIPENV